MSRRGLFLSSFLLVFLFHSAAWAETLADVLHQYGLSREDVSMPVTSYGVMNAPDAFAIGYYEDDGSGYLGNNIHIDYFDRGRKAWKSTVYDKSDLDENNPCSRTGSVLLIKDSGKYLYVVTHKNPSAGCTFVFSRTLEFTSSLYGWPVAVFSDGSLIYQHSQVHFAPTHYVELSLFSPDTGNTQQVYPPEPFSTVRKEQVEKVRRQYREKGDEWCRQMNHHCDPELFDSTLKETLVDDTTGSALTVVTFMDAAQPPERFDVVTVYRDVRKGSAAGFRELRTEELFKRFGQRPFAEYLRPGVVEDLFRE